MEIKSVIEEKKLQYSTVKNNNLNYSTVQYSYPEAKQRVESLDQRVYRDDRYLPFYVKALRMLGWQRILDLQSSVVNDERIGRPDLFNPEKVFAAALRREMDSKMSKQ